MLNIYFRLKVLFCNDLFVEVKRGARYWNNFQKYEVVPYWGVVRKCLQTQSVTGVRQPRGGLLWGAARHSYSYVGLLSECAVSRTAFHGSL